MDGAPSGSDKSQMPRLDSSLATPAHLELGQIWTLTSQWVMPHYLDIFLI